MKKIKYIALLTCFAAMIVSCDKIESDNYIVFSGVVGQWDDGNGVADKTQRAILEKYTGVRCVNCPIADSAIATAVDQYGHKLIALSIHDSSSFTLPYNDNPRLSTPDGQAWSQYFGVRGAAVYPNAIINRTNNGGAWDLFTPTSGINSRVDNIINQAAKIAVATSATKMSEGVSITVDIELLQDIADDLTLTLLIMEDGINATQLMPDGTRNTEYIHNHVLRDVITDIWGADIETNGTSGEKRKATYVYSEYDQQWNLNNCHIVALISKKETREILNVAECGIE